MKKTIILSLIVLASFGTAFSQSILSFGYEPASPIGDMTQFVDKFSLRGLSAALNVHVTKKITVGFTTQWTGFFDDPPRHSEDFTGGAITAGAWKEFYIWNLFANAKYFFVEKGAVIPYAGLSVGTAYTDQRLKVGTYEVNDHKWRFTMAPEVGMLLPMGMDKTWGFNLKARYQVNFWNRNDINLIQYINYSFGIYWKIYKRGAQYEVYE